MSSFQNARIGGQPGRIRMDMQKAAAELIPHLPGTWVVALSDQEPLPQWVQLVRLTDDLRLHVVASTRGNTEMAIEVRLGFYRDGDGNILNLVPLANQARIGKPRRRFRLEQRTPQSVASEITSRLIKPGEQLLPHIRTAVEAFATDARKRTDVIAALTALGIPVEAVHHSARPWVYLPGVTFRINDDGSAAVNAFKVPTDRVAAFAAFMLKLTSGGDAS